MSILYLAGSGPAAGVTAVATALAQRLRADGKRVMLLKPLQLHRPQGSGQTDQDVPFYSQVNSGNAHPEGWPIPAAAQDAGVGDLLQRIQAAFSPLSSAADVVLVEGLPGLDPSEPSAEASAALARALGARVLAVVRYDGTLQAQQVASAVKLFGGSLIGVLLNGVTQYRGHTTRTQLVDPLNAAGVRVLGAIPQDRRMLAPTVRQVAEHLGGELRLGDGKADELVEYFMVGGWFLDNGSYVFQRRSNKAVIVKADRPDLQMAALETSTVCLVLTGGREPVQYVVHHAEQKEVPLIQVRGSTQETMEQVASLQGRVTVHNPRKAQRFGELLAQHCDMETLYAGLGL
ncbi:MAG: phosphotransacetylase family protein [Chloroflexi bacterium]|nr:phosphotransacetylase family protein [Chloroflexota bacterium]